MPARNLPNFFSDLPAGVFLFDHDMVIRWLNKAAASMVGEAGEVVGRCWYDVFPEMRGRQQHYERVIAGESLSFRNIQVPRQESDRYFDVHYLPCGAPHGMAAIAVDVTKQHMADDQHLLNCRLEALGRLTASIAHDLNNYLTAISGFLELSHAALEDGEQPISDIDQAMQVVASCADLLGQLLEFTNRRPVPATAHWLPTMVECVAGRLLEPMLSENIRLDLDLDPTTGSCLLEPSSFEQLLVNLVINGRDAMPDGGILRVRTFSLRLSREDCEQRYTTLQPGCFAALEVSDNGQGMDKETRDHCFDPLYSTKNSRQNIGLGLSTCYRIVRESRGAITLDSVPERGSTFRVLLPRVDTVQDLEALPREQPPCHGGETVLLVEDQEPVRAIVSRFLSQHGYQVLEASNSGEAVLLVEQHDGPIDVLLTDVVMPRVSGPALATRVMRMRPDMRVLYMSGFTSHPAIQDSNCGSPAPLIEKPFRAAQLAGAVRRVLDSPDQLPHPAEPSTKPAPS